MNVLFYGRHRTFDWWRYLARGLAGEHRVRIASEFGKHGDIYIMPAFYRKLADGHCESIALQTFGEQSCTEIVRRCRLLRALDEMLALRMIGAMTQVLDEMLESERLDVVVSFMVDHYVLDILERLVTIRGGYFAGLVDAVFKGQMMFSTRGEHLPVRTVADSEIDAALNTIVRPTFAPFLVSRRNDFCQFARQYLYFRGQALTFKAIRAWTRDPFCFHWMCTGEFVPEYRVRLKDRRSDRYIAADWAARLNAAPFSQRVFIALQQNPEASTDYWVRSDVTLIDYVRVLLAMCDALGEAGFTVFVKDHPNMWGYRKIEVLERLAEFPHVVLVPYNVRSQQLIAACKATFTWTGTVGLQAALAGRCAVVVEEPYYYVPGVFLSVRSIADLACMPAAIATFEPPRDVAEVRRRVLDHVLRATVPGNPSSFLKFRVGDATAIAESDAIVRSLEQYLPAIVDRSRAVAVAAHR